MTVCCLMKANICFIFYLSTQTKKLLLPSSLRLDLKYSKQIMCLYFTRTASLFVPWRSFEILKSSCLAEYVSMASPEIFLTNMHQDVSTRLSQA